MLLHPHGAQLPCDQCRKFEHYIDGENAGQPIKRKNRTEFVARRSPLPCESSIGCEKGHWSTPLELTDQNWKAWNHYKEGCAVGFQPHEQRDAIVRRNAAIISMIEDQVEQHRQNLRLSQLVSLTVGAK